jgi:hypothetical protein
MQDCSPLYLDSQVIQRLGTQDTRGLEHKSAGPRIHQDLLDVVLQDFDHAPCLRAQVRVAISAPTHRMEFVSSVHCLRLPFRCEYLINASRK